MGIRYIPCQVNNEYIQVSNNVIGAEGSHDDVYLKITFDDMWDGYSKHIVWTNALGLNPTIIYITPSMLVDGSYEVPIPAEAKEYEGEVLMSIKGSITEDDVETRATLTTSTKFKVLSSTYDPDAEESQDVTPTIAEQLSQQINELSEIVTDLQHEILLIKERGDLT